MMIFCKKYIIWFLWLLPLLLTGCQPQGLREAQSVVAEADSLRSEGVRFDDSLRLAEAYATLNTWRVLYPDAYAHACYFYGRLLRDRDNPVAAMTCFINATHSCTHDYHILGRIYSNMADICQLEGNRNLAYDLHVISSEYFKKDGDLRAFYYGINNMAIQRAQQKDKSSAMNLVSQILRECSDSVIQTKVLETKALACRFACEYDSALYYVKLLQARGNQEQLGYVIKAQSFWYLHQYDSALYYAQLVLSRPCSVDAGVSMLYITSHNDPSIDRDSILVITSERADMQFAMTYAQGELSHAVELLQQDMTPNYKWIYGVAITFIVIGVIISTVMVFTKKRRAKAQEQLQRVKTELNDIHQNSLAQLEKICTVFRQSNHFKQDLCWSDYGRMSAIVNNQMFFLVNKLKQLDLTEKEIRLCILIVINFSYKEMADILPYSLSGLGKFKYSTAKKLGTDIKNMRKVLIKIAVGE